MKVRRWATDTGLTGRRGALYTSMPRQARYNPHQVSIFSNSPVPLTGRCFSLPLQIRPVGGVATMKKIGSLEAKPKVRWASIGRSSFPDVLDPYRVIHTMRVS